VSSCRKWQRECLEYARRAGVEHARLESRAKHDFILGTVRGAPFMLLVPRSQAGGMRGIRNLRADINRALRKEP
jgi:hypothetical protein